MAIGAKRGKGRNFGRDRFSVVFGTDIQVDSSEKIPKIEVSLESYEIWKKVLRHLCIHFCTRKLKYSCHMCFAARCLQLQPAGRNSSIKSVKMCTAAKQGWIYPAMTFLLCPAIWWQLTQGQMEDWHIWSWRKLKTVCNHYLRLLWKPVVCVVLSFVRPEYWPAFNIIV